MTRSKQHSGIIEAVTITQALLDRKLFGAALGNLASWSTWLAIWRAAFGLPLNAKMQASFAAVAGGRAPPTKRVRELWAVAGRRSGKSRMAAAIAIYLACFIKHQLTAGERGMVLVLAASMDQAGVVFGYVRGFLEASPVLRNEIASATRNEVTLRNGIVIAVHTNSFRTVRGRTLVAVVFDEASFWRDETSATPDIEVYRAILPSMATTNGMLIGVSTPYRKMGLLHQKHRDHFGKDDDDVLVVAGPSEVFNPTLDPTVIDAARAADPAAAQSEWDGLFRTDIAALLDDASIDAAIDYGRPLELPPRAGITYHAFADASAGRHDAFCMTIGHKEGDRFVADVVRGVPAPLDPRQVAASFGALAREYRCRRITHDAYAGEWVAGAFREAGIVSEPSPLTKSALYLEMVPAFTRGIVSIPNLPVLTRELRLLERRVARSGKDSVDAPRGISEDHANTVAGAIYLTLGQASKLESWKAWARIDVGPRPGEFGQSAILYARARGF